MNLREKIEEQLLLNGQMSTMTIANKVDISKTKTKYFPGEVNTILRSLVKKGKVVVSDEKGPRGGKLYRLAQPASNVVAPVSPTVVVETNKEEESTMSATFVVIDMGDAPEQNISFVNREEAVGTLKQFEQTIPAPIETPENLEVGTPGDFAIFEEPIVLDDSSQQFSWVLPEGAEPVVVVEEVEVTKLPINF